MEKPADIRKRRNRLSKEEIIDYAISQEISKNLYLERLMALGTKSFQKTSEVLDKYRISLFNEAEYTFDTASAEELDEVSIAPRPKKKRRKSKEIDHSEREVKTIHHNIENKECPDCGNRLVPTGQQVVEVLKYQKAKYYIERHIIYEYACNNCGKEKITKEDVPVRLIEGSKVSAGVVSSIATNKFVLDVPLYRQEKDLKRQGIPIARQNMSNWLIQSCERYLRSVFDQMHKEIQDLDIIHMDETTHICIEDKQGGRNKN